MNLCWAFARGDERVSDKDDRGEAQPHPEARQNAGYCRAPTANKRGTKNVVESETDAQRGGDGNPDCECAGTQVSEDP